MNQCLHIEDTVNRCCRICGMPWLEVRLGSEQMPESVVAEFKQAISSQREPADHVDFILRSITTRLALVRVQFEASGEVLSRLPMQVKMNRAKATKLAAVIEELKAAETLGDLINEKLKEVFL